MKYKTITLFCLMVALLAQAQYTNPGFYRVHNAYSDGYISIKGTHFEWSLKPDAFWPCILMLTDSAQISDPGSIIYIPSKTQTSLYAQGVSTYSLTGLWMEIDTAKAREGGKDTYIAITETMVQGKMMRCLFRDDGLGLTAGGLDKTPARWWIEPVNEASIDSSFLGLAPVSDIVTDADGWYWATMCVDYPVLLPIDGGVEGAYTISEVKMGVDSLYYASPVKVYAQGDTVPAATPMLFKCKAGYASGNKIIPVGDIANNTTFPLVNDMLMGNYFSIFSNHCNFQDASIMTDYIPEQATTASIDNLALGVDENGRLGFYPQAEGTYMAANTAWLNISGMESKDGVTSVILGEAPQAPEAIVVKGDANGDGVVSIKDVSAIIDYLMGIGEMPGQLAADNDVATINQEAADVNGDGKVSIQDVSCLIDLILEPKEEQ